MAEVVALVEAAEVAEVRGAEVALELGVMETTVFLDSITNCGVKFTLLGSESETISMV